MQLEAMSQIKTDADTFVQPGETFEIDDKFSPQLIASGAAKQVSPQQQPTPEAPSDAPSHAALENKTRTELEEFAPTVGLNGPFDQFDTKAKLIEAIEAKQAGH